ncbi:MAG: Minf_1886 family protein [Candidatus Brocadiia bacterium]
MATTDPEPLAEFIRQQMALQAAQKREPRYDLEAYAFVCEAVDHTYTLLGERRDLSGGELLDGMCDLALQRFGFLAPLVLEHWGVTRTDDLGRIVFALVEVGLLGKSPEDSMDDFREVFPLRRELEERYRIDLDEA